MKRQDAPHGFDNSAKGADPHVIALLAGRIGWLRNVKPRSSVESAPTTAKSSVDLRGMDSESALMELDRYIDSALRLGLNEFTIIHGKGTGVLRKAVQKHLKSHSNIKSCRLGVFGEGEDGVTIAELK